MTAYNRDYGIKQINKGWILTLPQIEDAKRREQAKKARQQVIAKAQALERKAARLKMRRERAAARDYEYEPA